MATTSTSKQRGKKGSKTYRGDCSFIICFSVRLLFIMTREKLIFILIILCLSHCSVNTGTEVELHDKKYILDIDYGNSRYIK